MTGLSCHEFLSGGAQYQGYNKNCHIFYVFFFFLMLPLFCVTTGVVQKEGLQQKIIHKLYGCFCCNLYFVQLHVSTVLVRNSCQSS